MLDPLVLQLLDTLADDLPDTVLAETLAEHLRTTAGLSADNAFALPLLQ
jgi:hypothetical protein